MKKMTGRCPQSFHNRRRSKPATTRNSLRAHRKRFLNHWRILSQNDPGQPSRRRCSLNRSLPVPTRISPGPMLDSPAVNPIIPSSRSLGVGIVFEDEVRDVPTGNREMERLVMKEGKSADNC